MGKKTILQILNESPVSSLNTNDAIVIDRPSVGQDPAQTKGATVQQVIDAAAEQITKEALGLGNVNNTADSNKPVSTAQQMAINTAVAAETQARNAADNVLQGNISAEGSRATGAESALQIAINTAQQALQGNITAEITRAETAETELQTALTAETTRAETAENTKVDKHATHANGLTDITNSPDNDGFSAVTTQTDTGTDFRFETNTEAGNPVMGGLVGKTAASASVGSRRLLFVNTTGGIRIHIRKDKGIPATEADLSDDDLMLNKGEIDSLVNDIMAALSQGLKTPGVIDKESSLPAASGVPNGTYYVVQDLDVTAAGQQGRAWKNDALSTMDWQVVIDNVFAPDGATIDLDAGGALAIAAAYQTIITGAVQNNRIEQTLPATDDQDDAQKLISRRAAFGLLPKQQEVNNAGKALVVGQNGVLAPGFPDGTASLDENGKIPVAQLPIDSTPTEASTNPVSSGGVKAEIDGNIIYHWVPDEFYQKLLSVGFNTPDSNNADMFDSLKGNNIYTLTLNPTMSLSIPGYPVGATGYACIEFRMRIVGECFVILYDFSGASNTQNIFFGGLNQPTINGSKFWAGWKKVSLVSV
jgi:hypothetical protein